MWEGGNCRWAQNVLSTSQKNWRGTELKVTPECIIRLKKFYSEIHNSLKGPFHRIDTLLLTEKSSSWWPHFISEWNLALISWCQLSSRLSHSVWQAGKWGAEQHLLLSLKNTDSGAHQSVPVHCKVFPEGFSERNGSSESKILYKLWRKYLVLFVSNTLRSSGLSILLTSPVSCTAIYWGISSVV